MSKSILNQRYCYKVNGSYIKRNKGKIYINDIRVGIKNRFIVGVGDSEETRMIREISNSNHSEEYINNLIKTLNCKKKEIKVADTSNINNLKKEIKEINNEILKASLEDRICNVIFNSEKDYDKYSEDGFWLNDKKFKLFLGTSGGIKNNTAMFVSEDVLGELNERVDNGADYSIPMLPSKLMAYKALICSSSTPVTNTNKILVVKDVKTHFKDKATYIHFDSNLDRPIIENINEYNVEVNACDGCGLINPKLAKIWSDDLKLDYESSGFVIRNSWIKGVLTTFDFCEYQNSREDMTCKKVVDIWGMEHDLKDIDIIINESMFKLCHNYGSLDSYLENCLKNGYAFSVTKSVPNVVDNERMLNYQYIQCLDLSDENIDELLKKDIREIKDVIGRDYIKSIIFGKGKFLNDNNVWSEAEDDNHIKALMINKDLINDDYIKDKIKRAIKKRIDLLKTGKITVEGNYQIAIGEPVILLEGIFELEPKGLLNKNEFYIKYWKDKGVKKVGGFRSPMSCKSNARVMNVCHKEEVDRWYGSIKNMIIFNAWDTSMSAFNGEDFDGDINFTTNNEVIVNGIYELPAIFCESESAEKIPNPTQDDFKKSIKRSFGNKVGSVTNFGSSCYDKISIFDIGSDEYKEIDYRIQCIQFYQQECIDSAKNGKPPRPIPSYWYNHKDDKLKYDIDESSGEILDSIENQIEIEVLNNTLTDKKPYYFRYIYKNINKEYVNFIESMEVNCLRTFRKTIEELKSAEIKTEKEIEFLEWYEKKIPLSNNPCIINKIAKKVETSFSGDFSRENIKSSFDFKVYMCLDCKDVATKREVNSIVNLYKEFASMNKNQRSKIEYTNKDDIVQSNNDRYYELKTSATNIISNEDILLNTLIELAYKKNKISKSFAWCIAGDLILKNLLKSNDNTIHYPIMDDNGDIYYSGNRFKMTSKKIKGVDI